MLYRITYLCEPLQSLLYLGFRARVAEHLVIVLLRILTKVVPALHYVYEVEWVQDDVS
jgi:hypothetical protein